MNEYKRFFNHIPSNLEQSNYRIFEPDSKAEILHWFSRENIPSIEKDELIKALINFDDGCGNFYRHRAYFLAAEALNYFPESYLGDVIVNQLLNWSYVYFSWQIIPKPLQAAARQALQVTDKQRVIAAFTKLLHTTTSRVTLRHAASELGKLDTGNKTAIAALILLLDISRDEHTQRKIIYSLANIGHSNENVVKTLISFLTNTSNVSLCWHIMTALGAIGKRNQQVIIALSERLKNNACHNDNDYFKTAITLWELNPHHLVAQNAIVRVLEATNDYHLIIVIMDNLLKISFDFQPVIKILSHKLASELEDVRLNCAYYLAKLDVDNQAAKQTLIEIITQTENICFDNEAFRYLLRFYPNHQDTVAVLTTTIKLHDRSFFDAIPKNIETSDSTHKTCIDALIFSIQESLSKHDCYNAIRLLECFDLKGDVLERDRVITTLVAFLQKNRGDNICLSAADALLSIDPGNKTAINILFEVLEFNRCGLVCESAENILLQAGYYHHQVVEKLVDLALSDKLFHSDNLCQAFRYLESIKDNQNYMHVLDTMMKSYLELFQDSLAPEYEEEYSISPCQYFSYNSQLIELSDKLTCVLQPQHLPQVIKSLKGHLNKSTYNNTSYRYEAIYSLIYHCAQNMSYVDFCHAWQH